VTAAVPHDLVDRARVHAALGDPARLAVVEALLLTDRTPQQLGQALDMPSNLLAHHLNVLAEAGVVSRTRSEGDGRRRYVRAHLDRLDGMVRAAPLTAREVLFVCTRNAARSQLAAAMWPQVSRIPATSAGADPADRIAPGAVAAARAHGLPVMTDRPRSLAEVQGDPDLVVTLCDRANESGRVAAGTTRLHWSLPDPVPAGDPAAFDRTVAELRTRIGALAAAVAPAA
jgi:protein-tyrosine-phosphatase